MSLLVSYYATFQPAKRPENWLNRRFLLILQYRTDMTEQLRHDIESALGKQLKTPKDFEFLREKIFSRLGILVSSTTLKRLWGYLREDVTARETTLDILSRFLGYTDWVHYTTESLKAKNKESDPVLSRRISVEEDLKTGDRILLSWFPDRECEIELIDRNSFRVVNSKNTRLTEGNTFSCSLIIEGEPLYIDNLVQNNRMPLAYICGKKNGIRFELLETNRKQ